MSGRRLAGVIAGVVALAVVVGAWAIPNLAGPVFVDVRVVATPVAAGPGMAPRKVILAGGPPTLVSAIALSIRIEGRYPLPVVLTWVDPPLRVELRALSEDGGSRAVWTASSSAAELERGADSPDGPDGARAVLVRSGSLDLPIGPLGGITLTDASGADLPAGRYIMRAWALGILSSDLELTVLE